MKSRTSTITLLALAIAATGCGVSGTGQTKARQASTSQTLADPIPIAIPTATPTPTPTSTTTPITGTEPVYAFPVRSTGYSTNLTFTVPVNRVLKVRFTPGQQDRTVAGTSFSPTYSKLAVYLTVGTRVSPTSLLSNGLSSDVQSSPAYDFSTAYTKACDADDTACRQYVTITVSKPNNDYFCFNYGTYCTHAQMYSTHPWNGVLEVQTDDTVALP